MLKITPGQRWISSTEPELGLGTVLRADKRQVDVIFTGCGELKHYTLDACPLLRVGFECGDLVAVDGRHVRLDAVERHEELLLYRSGDEGFSEGVIDPEQPMLPAALRLLIGQCDAGHLFDLRRQALNLQALGQEDFEHFAIDLLDYHGYRLIPISEHVFRIGAGDRAIPASTESGLTFTFVPTQGEEPEAVCIDRNHALIADLTAQFLQTQAGNAGFLIDVGLASRSAVLETVFVNGPACRHLAIDALGNVLADYQPGEQAVFRSRGSQIDLKPYKRSLERLYPALLQRATELAAQEYAGTLQALRLVVGSEFALFGKPVR